MKHRCPLCGEDYSSYPALSRTDNHTEICPRCGVRESLIAAGFGDEVIDAILVEIDEASPPAE